VEVLGIVISTVLGSQSRMETAADRRIGMETAADRRMGMETVAQEWKQQLI